MKTCTVSGSILSPSGEGLEGCRVRARVLTVVLTEGQVSGAPVVAKTSADGEFEIDLPQGATARLEIPETGLDAVFVVPAKSAVSLSGLSLVETPDPLSDAALAEALGRTGPRPAF